MKDVEGIVTRSLAAAAADRYQVNWRTDVKGVTTGWCVLDDKDELVAVARALPEHVPATRLRWVLEQKDWLMLAFDDVAGRTPQRPWQPDELRAVLDMLMPLATAMTPAPAGLPKLDTTADLDRDFSLWRRLAAGNVSADPQLVGARWRRKLDDLAAL